MPIEISRELSKYQRQFKHVDVTANWNEKTKRWGFLAYDRKIGSYWLGWMINQSRPPRC